MDAFGIAGATPDHVFQALDQVRGEKGPCLKRFVIDGAEDWFLVCPGEHHEACAKRFEAVLYRALSPAEMDEIFASGHTTCTLPR